MFLALFQCRLSASSGSIWIAMSSVIWLHLMAINILQWNCRGLHRKLPELKTYICSLKQKPEVIAIQETHLVHRYTPRIAGYDLVRKDRDIHGGGICFFVSTRLKFHVKDIFVLLRLSAST